MLRFISYTRIYGVGRGYSGQIAPEVMVEDPVKVIEHKSGFEAFNRNCTESVSKSKVAPQTSPSEMVDELNELNPGGDWFVIHCKSGNAHYGVEAYVFTPTELIEHLQNRTHFEISNNLSYGCSLQYGKSGEWSKNVKSITAPEFEAIFKRAGVPMSTVTEKIGDKLKAWNFRAEVYHKYGR